MRTCLLLLTGVLLTAVTAPCGVAALKTEDLPSTELQPMFFNTSSRHVVTQAGRTALLHCSIQHLGDKTVAWVRRRDLHILTVGQFAYTTDSRFAALHDGAQQWTLKLLASRLSDSGLYECRVSSKPLIVQAIRLQVVEGPIWWKDAPQRQNLVAGRRALITCVTVANSPVNVKWYHSNGTRIRDNERFTLQENGLQIENVSGEDDGVYVCRAEMPAEGAVSERRITVEVYSRPEITLPLPGTEVTIVEGVEGSMPCQASGKPTPHRSWQTPDGSDAEGVPGLRTDSSGTLTFSPARRQMAGQYRCRATNELGTVETTIQVEVIVRPEVVRYENMTSSEAESAALECRVSSSPLPTVSFRKAGSDTSFEEGVFSGDDRVMVQQRQEDGEQVGVLTIRELTRTDAGLYECVATNGGGQAAAPGRLTVQYPPWLSGPAAGQVFTWTGQPANLSCRAQAEPEAAVSWQFGGARPEDDPQLQQTQDGGSATLTVTPTEARYFGVYTCTATNTLGSSSLNITLREPMPPGPVSGVTVQEVTATSVKFSVSAPASDGGLPVTSYRAEYWLQEDPMLRHSQTGPADRPPFSVTDLTPGQTYLFRFAAQNEAGNSIWSDVLRQVMPKISVPQPPQILTAEGTPAATEVGSDAMVSSDQAESYEVRWRAGADNGADIDSYQVSFYKMVRHENTWRAESSAAWRTWVVEPPGPLAFRLTDLKPDNHYRVELRAHSRLGLSAPARLMVHTAAEPERGPRVSVISKQIVADVGSTVELKCSIPVSLQFSASNYVQLWRQKNDSAGRKRMDVIISVNTIWLIRDARFSMLHEQDGPETDIYTLKIRDVREEDQGTYECQFQSGRTSIGGTMLLSVRLPSDVSDNST